jgi:hypothetical protein
MAAALSYCELGAPILSEERANHQKRSEVNR